METHYWGEIDVGEYGGLVEVNEFWCDYAHYLLTKERGPFLTASFTGCYDQRQTILATTFLTLPHSFSKNHQFTADDHALVISAAGNVIIFKK